MEMSSSTPARSAFPSFDQVLLARHGQTEWNVLGRRQGQQDSALTAQGQQNARRLALLAAQEEVDGIFSSPQGRALTTATTIGDVLGREVVVIDELREVHHGDLAGLSDEETAARFPGLLERRHDDLYSWRFPGGGESYEDGAARVTTALHRIEASGSRRPVIVAHEMIGRMVIMVLEGLEPAAALGRSLPHGEFLRFD
jgi:probable phosphoglycerate mutase